MFKFNFGGEGEGEPSASPPMNPAEPTKLEPQEILPAIKYFINSMYPMDSVTFENGASLQKYKKTKTQDPEQQTPLGKVVAQGDVVPGLYEGGFKLWECATDLINHLISERFYFYGKKVLDLGCGHGMPGLYSIKMGAPEVHFQDYNAEVLTELTIPNIYLNLGPKGPANSRFFCGDWELLDSFLGDLKYDLIFTSDTLYNPANYPKLFNFLQHHLKEDGEVFIAAKTYYFGVGGGTRLFEEVVRQMSRETFQIVTVKTLADGSSNMREILRMTRVPKQ